MNIQSETDHLYHYQFIHSFTYFKTKKKEKGKREKKMEKQEKIEAKNLFSKDQKFKM